MKTPKAIVVTDRPRVLAWWIDISSRPATIEVAEGMTLHNVQHMSSNLIRYWAFVAKLIQYWASVVKLIQYWA
ncbi:hypothetical protein Dsin_029319 [Dipteronia sinensis]|uniref:Uncharacterized protein n=1 Tax=Dipteronia sinensis TaxID=43782 RepID=A0AAE0DV24_9ROSI|nr:hypothetical protein Dsin_029319 [Dipteronia sinensis]